MSTNTHHIPVLVEEAVKALAVQPGGRYIDCTLGGGGHAAAILEQSSPGGQLLGIDADPEAIETARGNLAAYRSSILLVNDNFANLQSICYKHDFVPAHAILFDLGLSSLQLGADGRGFSFQREDPLDMRFSPDQEISAADIVNDYGETELARLIKEYGQERNSRRIARRIVEERPINTTLQLAKVVERASMGRRGKIHPATKTFQALRIAVNQELEKLESALKQAVSLLGFGGRLVVISYHSLEDRIVKQFMIREATDCICPPGLPKCLCGHTASLKLINKKVITPSPLEVGNNPRSRSAKLRTVESIIPREEHFRIVESLCSSTKVKDNAWKRPILLKRLRQAFMAA